MARKVVGLDIGTTAVRAAEVSVRRGQVMLERVGQAGLPDGAVVGGEVIDPAAVAIAIKNLWRRTRISSRRVIIGVANQRVVVRLVDLPWMPPAELRGSLAFQAGDYLPIPVDQTELDFAVIGEHEASGGQRLPRVLLVANGAIYVQNVPTGQTVTCSGGQNRLGYPISADVTDYGCRDGDVFLSGTLRGRLTIAAENNIIIIVANTTYSSTGPASADLLGLVANQFIQVYHPVNNGGRT